MANGSLLHTCPGVAVSTCDGNMEDDRPFTTLRVNRRHHWCGIAIDHRSAHVERLDTGSLWHIQLLPRLRPGHRAVCGERSGRPTWRDKYLRLCQREPIDRDRRAWAIRMHLHDWRSHDGLPTQRSRPSILLEQ